MDGRSTAGDGYDGWVRGRGTTILTQAEAEAEAEGDGRSGHGAEGCDGWVRRKEHRQHPYG